MVIGSRLSWSEGPAEATSSKSSLDDKRFVSPQASKSTDLYDDPFREHFTFLVPRRFQQSVPSVPAPLPGGRWKYSVRHEETADVDTSEFPDPKSLYLFGKKDEIKDLDMEDGFSGSTYPLLVGGADQTVSVSVTGCILNDTLLTTMLHGLRP